MNTLLLLSIAVSAIVGVLCTVIYLAVSRIAIQIGHHQKNLDHIELRLNEQIVIQERLQKRIDQLATDVLHREIYQNAEDRHQLAIQDAKKGRTLAELIQRHGLSSDEAALILSLHTTDSHNASRVAEYNNANLQKPAFVDGL